MSRRCRRGAGLGEMLVATGLAGIVLAGAAAVGMATARRARVDAAARAVAADIRRLRSEAVSRRRHEALHLERRADGTWLVAVVEDGDGDGVRAEDMRRGIDVVREGPERASRRWGASPGFLEGLPSLRSPPPGDEPLGALDDPVRFGARDLVSCSPRGTVTPGTLYVTDGHERQMAIVAAATGRVRLWEWRVRRGAWVPR